MSDLKRLPVKYIRDKCKSAYVKDSSCKMCEATDELEFHHFSSMTQLFNRWIRKNGIVVKTESDILEHREKFIEEHKDDIYNKTVTLCKQCHSKLHSIYGKTPSLGTAGKQERWIQRQREKNGLV